MLELNTFIIDKNNYEEDLFEMYNSIDADFNGYNGEEYLWPQARENGSGTNLGYVLSLSKQKHKDRIDKIIEEVIEKSTITWSSCYKDWQYNVIEHDNSIIVSIATI